MALNKKQTQWVAGGLIAGVLLTLVFQWGMAEFEDRQATKKAAEFIAGYEQASDKNAYIKSYDWNSDGVSLNLSSASADEGTKSEMCSRLKADLEATEMMAEYVLKDAGYGNVDLSLYYSYSGYVGDVAMIDLTNKDDTLKEVLNGDLMKGIREQIGDIIVQLMNWRCYSSEEELLE